MVGYIKQRAAGEAVTVTVMFCRLNACSAALFAPCIDSMNRSVNQNLRSSKFN